MSIGGSASKSKTKSKSQYNQNSKTQNTPYGPAQVGIDHALNSSRSIYDETLGTEYFPGQKVTPFAPQTMAGLDSVDNAVKFANPIVTAAGNTNTGIANGTNANLARVAPGNPFSNSEYQRGADRIGDQFKMQFAGTGMTGQSRHQKAYGESLADYTANFGHQRYDTDQANLLRKVGLQSQAAAQAPALADAQFIPARAQVEAGQVREAKGQAIIDADIQAHQYNNDRKMQVLQQYLASLGPVGEAFKTTTGNMAGSQRGTSRTTEVGIEGKYGI